MTFLIKVLEAVTHPLCLGAPPKNGITTAPALPFLPSCRWEAVGLPILCQLSLKHTLPDPGLSVIVAVPVPSGSPFGVSDLPLRLTVNVLSPEAPSADTASSESATIRASAVIVKVFMPRSSQPRRPGYIGHRS